MGFKINSKKKLKSDRQLFKGQKVQKYIDSNVIRLMSGYTPKDKGTLIDTADKLTKIGSGIIRQGGRKAPYGRKWYYKKANFTGSSMRGNKWFKRCMQNGGAKAILQGIKRNRWSK